MGPAPLSPSRIRLRNGLMRSSGELLTDSIRECAKPSPSPLGVIGDAAGMDESGTLGVFGTVAGTDIAAAMPLLSTLPLSLGSYCAYEPPATGRIVLGTVEAVGNRAPRNGLLVIVTS